MGESSQCHENLTLLKQYNDILQGQVKQGIIEKVTERKVDHNTHHLPHYAVLTPS